MMHLWETLRVDRALAAVGAQLHLILSRWNACVAHHLDHADRVFQGGDDLVVHDQLADGGMVGHDQALQSEDHSVTFITAWATCHRTTNTARPPINFICKPSSFPTRSGMFRATSTRMPSSIMASLISCLSTVFSSCCMVLVKEAIDLTSTSNW